MPSSQKDDGIMPLSDISRPSFRLPVGSRNLGVEVWKMATYAIRHAHPDSVFACAAQYDSVGCKASRAKHVILEYRFFSGRLSPPARLHVSAER
jgi:hypothetical protein